MRVLLAGDWHSDLHEDEMARSLRRLGHEVSEFKWHTYFTVREGQLRGIRRRVRSLLLRAQNKYLIGPRMRAINQDFVANVLAFRPNLVFVYRGTHIAASTLAKVRQALPECLLVGYNNDDPFSPTQPRYYWRHFMRAIPMYDLMLAYRERNLAEYRAAGAQHVELLRSWYVPGRNHPIDLTAVDRERFDCDVVFVGHYEPDGRVEYLEEIVRRGYRVRLFGPTKYWERPLSESPVLASLTPVRMVWGEDYNRALCGAKIALCFLSKLNRDTYTRRCFEIPAAGTLMLSEYTDDLADLYREGEEVDFFRTKAELIDKIESYMRHDDRRAAVAQAGHLKVQSAGHDIDSRMRMMLKWVAGLAEEKGRHGARD